MKKLVPIALLAFITAFLLGYTLKPKQPTFLSKECIISCYNAETKYMIEMDAAKDGFAQLHNNPKDYTLENPIGSTLFFKTIDGNDAQGYYIPAKNKSNKWLFVIQEWWGLNDYIKKEAERFYNQLDNVNVLAIDMYDGKVATTRDSAGKYMQAAKPERLENIVKAAITYAGSNAKICTVGWCFGGGWSLQASLLAGTQAAGCIMYYGRPETNTGRLKNLNCDVLGFFSNNDRGIGLENVYAFEQGLKLFGKKADIFIYNAGHGFANPSNPIYNKILANETHEKAIAFLKSKL